MVTYHPVYADVAPGRVAVGASIGTTLIGVAVADFAGAVAASMESIVVDAAHRGRGVGRGLLNALERRARAHGFTRIEARYHATRANAPALARALDRSGWDDSGTPVWILGSSIRIVDAPWMAVPVPADYELFSWADLTASERSQLASAEGAARACPAALTPFPSEAVEPACSVGVRHAGRVVGWMLTHRVDDATVRYTSLYVEPAHRPRFCGLALLTAALRRQDAAGIPRCLCAVADANAAMMRIVRRRLEAWIDSKTPICFAHKTLG